jgi:membrane protease YdiL (CAAX protease family)
MESDRIQIGTLLISMAVIVFVEAAAYFVIPACTCNPLLIVGAARILEMALIILTVMNWGKGLSSIGLIPTTMVQGLKKGLIWSACFGIATAFTFIGLFLIDIDPFSLIKANLPKKPKEIMFFFAVAGLIGPIAEEAFFRGILYGFLRRWGILIALVFSTLLFVLAHSVSCRLSPPQIVGGILFAVSYELEGSLMVPITLHVLGNLSIFTLSLIF